MEMNRNTFAAYVDGELSPEQAAQVVLHLADHPEDRAHVNALMELNEALGQAYDQPMLEPIPPRIRAAILGQRVVAFPKAPRVRRRGLRDALWAGAGALAAAVAAFMILTPGRDGPPAIVAGALLAQSPAAEALSRLASGQSRFVGDGLEMSPVASFRASDARYCREFRLQGRAGVKDGVACAQEGGWRVHALASRAASAPSDGISPAAGGADDPVGAALDELGAGFTLPPAEEAAAISAGWR